MKSVAERTAIKDELFLISEWEKKDEGKTVRIYINKSHPIFEGHFPGNPIIPGVCLLVLFRKLQDSSPVLKGYQLNFDAMKFVNLLSPASYDSFNVTIEANDEMGKAKITASSGTTVFAILQLSI